MATLNQEQMAVAKRSVLLGSLHQEDFEQLLARMDFRSVSPGQAIFRKGQAAESFFLILSGRVRIYLLNPSGDEQILHIYGTGETFAEAAVLAEKEYPAWADALEETCLLEVQRSRLTSIVASHPRLALGMMAGLTGKLHEFAGLIEQLSLKEVPARLAAALLAESEEAGTSRFRLKQSKRQLAARLGTVAETLSRALAKLRKSGAIDVQGREITILDADQLEDIAAS
jgi:CRP/FNR family transcriptional regulator